MQDQPLHWDGIILSIIIFPSQELKKNLTENPSSCVESLLFEMSLQRENNP